MNKISRRQLARYAANEMLAGKPAKKLSRQLAAVLATSHRTDEVGLLADDIASELEARGMFASAKVTSARPINASLRKQLLAAVKQATDVGDAELSEVIDASVLGGLQIETANHSWDETIARRLNELKGASR